MKKRLLTLIGLLVLPTALFCQVANVSANAMTLVTSYGQVTQSWIEDMNNGGGPVSTVSVGQWLPNPFLGLCFAHMHLTGTSPSATVLIQGTNDPTNIAGGTSGGAVTLFTSSALTSNDAGDAGQLWATPAYIRYNVTAISGTSAKVFITISGARTMTAEVN